MSYTFTEKKRIRNSFGKRWDVLDVPYLLTTQVDSYKRFLQSEVPLAQRLDEGLQRHAVEGRLAQAAAERDQLDWLGHCSDSPLVTALSEKRQAAT